MSRWIVIAGLGLGAGLLVSLVFVPKRWWDALAGVLLASMLIAACGALLLLVVVAEAPR